MPRRRQEADAKIESLREQRSLNPHPETVSDPLFEDSDFFDARDLLKDREPESLLEEMVRQSVAAVPGRAFGKGYEDWFRLCFVAVPEERLAEGIDRLNRVLGPQ